MQSPVTIDIVSDITCPWCAVGISALQQAIERVGDAAPVALRIHPFELNPDMPPQGRNIVEHLGERLGAAPDRLAASRVMLKAKAAEVGFAMETDEKSRIYNSFDAHRLLHWAGLEGRQAALKRVLLEANFTHGENIADPDVLVAAAQKAGLDGAAAREVLASGRYGDDVRAQEHAWQARGIDSVPAFIFAGRYLVSGAQPVDTFEQVIRQVAAQAA